MLERISTNAKKSAKRFAGDLKTVFELVRPNRDGATHAERLENFYKNQASHYDQFRQRLLRGREEMIARGFAHKPKVWADFGGGTGANVEFAKEHLGQLEHLTILDLTPSLLQVARERIERIGLSDKTEMIEADVTVPVLPAASCDLVTFSYSITMIPEWFKAIEQAYRVLKPGGRIAVVDFFVTRKSSELAKHSLWQRTFWPFWFGLDSVHLNPDHPEYLRWRFKQVSFESHLAKVPWLPSTSKVPYYIFVGEKLS